MATRTIQDYLSSGETTEVNVLGTLAGDELTTSDVVDAKIAAGGGGSVDSVVGGINVTVDATDPANPIVNSDVTAVVETVVGGTGVTVDATDPANPIVTSTASGGGTVDTIVAGSDITVTSTDPANPVVGVSVGSFAAADINARLYVDTVNKIGYLTSDGSDPTP